MRFHIALPLFFGISVTAEEKNFISVFGTKRVLLIRTQFSYNQKSAPLLLSSGIRQAEER